MPFSEAVRIMLYARCGNRCAFPGCKARLVFTLGEPKEMVNMGKAAHIVAESRKGPRGRSALPISQRNSYQNGIILCTHHHADVVDKLPSRFSISRLRSWKSAHERKYGRSSPWSQKRIQALTAYADYIDEWSARALLDGWQFWTAPLLRSGSHRISVENYHRLLELCSWLATRVWSGVMKPLEQSFLNFQLVTTDFIRTFDKHAEAHGNILMTDMFYKRYDPTRGGRSKAQARFEFHVTLLEDLVLEMTRAANLVCQRVREMIDAQFRVDQGFLVVESGMYDDGFHRHVVVYRPSELRVKAPYPGLERFMKIRSQRDLHFGTGIRKDYLRPE